MKKILLLLALLFTPTAYAVECVAIQNESGVVEFSESNLPECLNADGEQGQWEEQYLDGTIAIGKFVDGKRHGQWVHTKTMNRELAQMMLGTAQTPNEILEMLNFFRTHGSETQHIPYKHGKVNGVMIIQNGNDCTKKVYENDALINIKKCY